MILQFTVEIPDPEDGEEPDFTAVCAEHLRGRATVHRQCRVATLDRPDDVDRLAACLYAAALLAQKYEDSLRGMWERSTCSAQSDHCSCMYHVAKKALRKAMPLKEGLAHSMADMQERMRDE